MPSCRPSDHSIGLGWSIGQIPGEHHFRRPGVLVEG
jgi:hypothetical protein